MLLALMVILAGFKKHGNREGTAGYIASGGLPLPMVLAARVGLLEVIGGIAVAIGFRARWAALALGLFALLATHLLFGLATSTLLGVLVIPAIIFIAQRACPAAR